MQAAPRTLSSGWYCWGASVQGLAHRRACRPNKDAWVIRCYGWGEIAVVSDGLSSRPLSELGARAACRAAARTAVELPTDPELRTRWRSELTTWPVPGYADDKTIACLFSPERAR